MNSVRPGRRTAASHRETAATARYLRLEGNDAEIAGDAWRRTERMAAGRQSRGSWGWGERHLQCESIPWKCERVVFQPGKPTAVMSLRSDHAIRNDPDNEFSSWFHGFLLNHVLLGW